MSTKKLPFICLKCHRSFNAEENGWEVTISHLGLVALSSRFSTNEFLIKFWCCRYASDRHVCLFVCTIYKFFLLPPPSYPLCYLWRLIISYSSCNFIKLYWGGKWHSSITFQLQLTCPCDINYLASPFYWRTFSCRRLSEDNAVFRMAKTEEKEREMTQNEIYFFSYLLQWTLSRNNEKSRRRKFPHNFH